MAAVPPDPCVFCDIVTGHAEASFALKDEATVTFAVLHPINPGHVVVVPRRHIERIADLDAATASRVWSAAVLVGAAVTRVGGEALGVNLMLSDGEVEGQEVPHVHLHVVPRHRDDGLHIDAEAWKRPAPSRMQLDESMTSLRAALGRAILDP